MFTPELLEMWLMEAARSFPGRPLLQQWLPAICGLLNAYGSELTVANGELDVKCMLQRVAGDLGTRATIAPEELKSMVVAALDSVEAPPTIATYSLASPSTPHTEAVLRQSVSLHQITKPKERQEIAKLRTKFTADHGKKLASAALSLKHRIKWLPRGDEGFLGVSTDTHPRSGKGVSHFSQWLQGVEFDELRADGSARMNCWESVCYTAYVAGLVSRGVLRGMFDEATTKGNNRLGEPLRLDVARNKPPSKGAIDPAIQAWIDTLFHHLKGDRAVAIKRNEDTPRKGDLVFVGGMAHVCICVGKQEDTDKDIVPHVMSLWHHDDEQYTLLPFTELFKSRASISIHPCPF
jgi:hypothetical protein